MILLGLISVEGIRSVSRFFFFCYGYPVFLAPVVEKIYYLITYYLHCITFTSLLEISWLYLCGLFLVSQLCSIDIFVFLLQYHMVVIIEAL